MNPAQHIVSILEDFISFALACLAVVILWNLFADWLARRADAVRAWWHNRRLEAQRRKADPETALAAEEGAHAPFWVRWGVNLVLVLAAVYVTVAGSLQRAGRWFAVRRVCSVCKRHLGGNPFAGASDGFCTECLIKHQHQWLRVELADSNARLRRVEATLNNGDRKP